MEISKKNEYREEGEPFWGNYKTRYACFWEISQKVHYLEISNGITFFFHKTKIKLTHLGNFQ